MTLTPRLRKAAFLAHVTFSVGWLGAVVAYLALAVGGLRTQDALVARSSYLSMELVGWSVIIPFSIAALASGLVQSLGTEWGVFRHYWIAVKFFAGTAASLVLLTHMQVVGQMADVARETTLSGGEFGGLRLQLVVHAVGGLAILLGATVISIYKPWGLTPYGRRKKEEMTPGLANTLQRTIAVNRGRYVLFGIIAVLLILLLIHHLLGGGIHRH
jgi:hypothetical protein